MCQNLIIREYVAEDEPAWLDLHAVVAVDSYAWWIVVHRKPEYKNDTVDLVAESKGNLIGFITVEINSPVISHMSEDYGFVWEFGVHRKHRRRGVGRALIDKAHRLLRRRYQITTSIWYSQDTRAQQYYRHLGMKEIDRHWQFSLHPDSAIKEIFSRENIDCWEIRGSCPEVDFETVRRKYRVIEDDDTLKPRLCIGFSFTVKP